MATPVWGAALAAGQGAVVCAVLFSPIIAVSARRNGRRAWLWAGAGVYAWMVWMCAVLPVPQTNDFTCVGVNLNALEFVDDIAAALGSATPLTSGLLLQIVFNLVFFAPLGFLIRALTGRGWLVTLLAALAVSLLVELTQLTGVWGIYDCAYRVFDIVDLLSNMAGALLGWALAGFVMARLRQRRTPDSAAPVAGSSPVTRRLVAMVIDAVGFWLLAVSVGGAYDFVATSLASTIDARLPSVIGTISAVVLWAVVTFATGQSPGDRLARVRYVDARVPQSIARLLRLAGGVVGWCAVGFVPIVGPVLATLFACAAVVLVFVTPDARGLPGLLSTQRLAEVSSVVPPDRS